MIYATDLDRTIIFSSKFLQNCEKESICVEYKDGKPISYMCKESLEILEKLKKKIGLRVIPITTRSVEQYKRVTPIQDCEYAITTNGGIILYNGEIFEPWKKRVDKVLEHYVDRFEEMLEILKQYSIYFEKEPKLVDDVFYFIKLKDNQEENEKLLEILNTVLDLTLWNFTLQGLKLYIIPKEISKENALLYLKWYLKEKFIVVSGDGKLDYGFLKVGNMIYIPENSEVLKYILSDLFIYKSVPEGLEGTIDLFDNILKIS